MTLGKNIRHGVAWLFVGNAGKQVLIFLFGIVLARLLAPKDFGILLTVQVFAGLAGFVAGGGMGQALVRAKETTEKDYDIVFTLQLIIGSFIYAGFFFAAPWFAKWYDTPLYTNLLRITALSFILRPFVNLPSSILYREMRFKAQTVVNITSLLISNSAIVTMAYLGYGVWSLVWGGLIGSILNAAMLIPLAKWRPRFSVEFRRGRDIARYGFMVSANDIVCYIRDQVSIFILSRTLGPSSVGLYNKGESLSKMPHSFITGSVYNVLFRSMAVEQDNLDKSRYLFFRSMVLVALYATPFYIGLLWLSEPLIRGVYGARWVESAAPLAILALAWPFWLVETLSGAPLAARNWLGRELPVQISSVIITALAVLIGLNYGISGVAWAIVCVSAFNAFYMLWLALACLKAHWVEVPRALAPAVALNLMLAGSLALISALLPDFIRGNDYLYIAALGTVGALLYVTAFLYIPFSSLATEQQRWKLLLRLAPTKQGKT